MPLVVSYNPLWPQMYADEQTRILERAGDLFLAIEHVGSTSISGLAAKPIIDIMASIDTLDRAEQVIAALESLGYENVQTDMPRRLFLRRYNPEGDNFHLHVVEQVTWDERNERLLRDYLRQHPDVAREYGELKQQLGIQYAEQREEYTRAKTAFIQTVVDRARDAAGLPRVDVWEE